MVLPGVSRDTLLRVRVVLPAVLPGVSRDTLLRVRGGVARHAPQSAGGAAGGVAGGVARHALESARGCRPLRGRCSWFEPELQGRTALYSMGKRYGMPPDAVWRSDSAK